MTNIIKKSYRKSPLNYIGGKYKLLPQILPLFPKEMDIFLDLFCGGLNVALNIDKIAHCKEIICNDNLIYLIELYRFLQNNSLDSTLNDIENIIKKYNLNLHNKQGYLALRDAYNADKSPLMLFTLIAFGFNHQIRFNNSHHFNTLFGENRSSFNNNMKQNLVDFIVFLQEKNIRFCSFDFMQSLTLSNLTNKSFVYADPPYFIAKGTYNDGKRCFSGWNEILESKLLESLKKLDSKHIKFALSNVLIHKNNENRILKHWIEVNNFNVYYLSSNYTNSNYQAKHKNATQTQEILVTNYKASLF
ncbi:DNA adenine methylase [Helicobacter sp. 16-1353]|uniref:Dam family site-specific DNA-(adenine-N6)-methyltransferase n=1 Tax=Helicobacter sp. 16-1353 TaxID=2004996 RepID=UPI000DCB86BB|nr:Dam family site-specific DNA-(adenine-N6)-methyltransferase [Helicobacter sp. 16-1353]RAX51819.1 DNA adenine methylase [Helicobacter sp. 16-1353]